MLYLHFEDFLIYYNLNNNNDVVKKQACYYISRRERSFHEHILVAEQFKAFFKCPVCKEPIKKEATSDIAMIQCENCCQRFFVRTAVKS